MLITFWLAILLFFVVGILIIILGFKIGQKLNLKEGAGGGIGVLVGIVFVIYGFVGPSRCYVVTGENEMTHYMVFGSPEYQIEGGSTIQVSIDGGHCFVINESMQEVVIESIVYGAFFGGGDTEWIYQGEGQQIEGGKIDYFFDDAPPDEISVSDGTDVVTKLWLRMRRL